MDIEDNSTNITGTRIKEMRLENQLTQKALAHRLGLKNDTAVANYEAGYSIPKDDIKLKMCELFNCSVDYLMGHSFYKTYNDYYKAIKHYVAVLEFSSSQYIYTIDSILSELSCSTNKNLDCIEKLIFSKVSEHRRSKW